jgi:regulatory protein YycI of two-component signal transduction system YycFG
MMSQRLVFVVVILLVLILLGDSFRIYINKKISSKVYSQQNENNLDRELDIFFEKAGSLGAKDVAKMSIEERAERAERGAFLEDEIFEVRDRLRNLQDEYMGGNKEVLNDIKLLEDELNGLKQDYIDLVGGGISNIPLYFGRGPTELQ